jgi:hypothetical protein
MAAPPQLMLRQAIQSWLGERDHWAFTQRAVEYESDHPHERLERYDPSKSGNARWELLSIDGRPPTAEQRAAWEKRKFKKTRHRFDAPIGDYFDFDDARILDQTPANVRFQVPLRPDKNWLFPTDKVDVRVTINKSTRALEHLTAHVREPFKVFLGLARVTNGELDLDFLRFDDVGGSPSDVRPAGNAHVSVSKFGERVDFTWSDFKRVTPAPDPNATAENEPDGP